MRIRALVCGMLVGAAVIAGCSGDDTVTRPSATELPTTARAVDPQSTPPPSSSAPSATVASTSSPTTSTVLDRPSVLTTAAPPSTDPPCTLPDDGPHTISSAGLERSYVTRRPASPAAGPVPVVVLLHGFAGSAVGFSAASGVADVAASGGVLLVAPQGQGDPAGWEIPNWAADAQFVNDVLDEVGASGCAATDGVWVGGHSAGSAFAAYYGCANTDRVAGVWLNAGLPPPLCTDRSPAVVISHGTADPVVPYDGGDQRASDQTFVLDPVPASAAAWAMTAGCAEPAGTLGPAEVGIRTWTSCSKGSYVRLYTIEHGGHVWPGAVGQTGIGATTQGLDAACLLVESARTGTAQPAAPETCR